MQIIEQRYYNVDGCTICIVTFQNGYKEAGLAAGFDGHSDRYESIALKDALKSRPDMFVAGWRPFLGWVCTVGVGVIAIVFPVVNYITVVAVGYTGLLPAIDTGLILTVLGGLLGVGIGSRSIDKAKGVETTSIK